MRQLRRIVHLDDCEVRCRDIEGRKSHASLRAWIEHLAEQSGVRWMLGYALDGVVWGKFDDGRLVASPDVLAADGDQHLRQMQPGNWEATLYEARLFGEHAEVHIWTKDGNWTGGMVSEDTVSDGHVMESKCRADAPYLLFGDRSRPLAGSGFTLLYNGRVASQYFHAVPVDWNIERRGRLCLRVRSYRENENPHFVRAGRLAGFCTETLKTAT